MQHIEVERDGAVARVTLARPDAANGIDMIMGRELMQAMTELDESPDVRAVLLTGSGRFFSAGGDLKSFASEGPLLPARLKELTLYLHGAISRMARMNAPVVCAVNGIAAGAGMSLAVACDLVLAAEDARFTMAYTGAGLSPDGSSTWFLPRLIGDRRTRELMLTNRTLSARDALDWGLVNEVVTPEKLQDRALLQARQLADGPTRAYGAVKQLLASSSDTSLETQMELEARAIAAMARSADGQEGIAAFVAKRAPDFCGE